MRLNNFLFIVVVGANFIVSHHYWDNELHLKTA